MTLGAFAVLTSMAEGSEPRDGYSDFAGLGFKRPFLAIAMSLFMLSLAGIPTVGWVSPASSMFFVRRCYPAN